METRIWIRASAHHCKSIRDILIQMTAKVATTSAIHGAARRRTDMERLTEKREGRAWPRKIWSSETIAECLDRLAAYEETGMEPEEIIELKGRMEGLDK